MPSRKSVPSDVPSDTRRSSMRRLSSIASFQTLFGRRKSTGTTLTNTSTAIEASNVSSSSNLSLSSTAANAPEPCKHIRTTMNNVSQILPAIENHEQPAPAQQTSKRSSYTCLPDDVTTGMPRSRTFSNLPLPIKSKKTPLIPYELRHTSLLSANSISRVPHPVLSTRTHSHSRAVVRDSQARAEKSRMQRSDTEPLLKRTGEQTNNLPRSTAFKENLSLSPIKFLGGGEAFGGIDTRGLTASSQPQGSSHKSRAGQVVTQLGRSPYSDSRAGQTGRETKSSPTRQALGLRRPLTTASQSFQRQYSQPALTDTTNLRRDSHQNVIKQARPTSARQAPTPLVVNRATALPASGPFKLLRSSQKSHRNLLELSGQHVEQNSPSRQVQVQTVPSRHLEISTAEGPAYWCGRICALTDRYRNEELNTHLTSDKRSRSHNHPAQGNDANTARLCRAFDYVHNLCVTQQAKDSLSTFQAEFARTMNIPVLARPIVLNAPGMEANERVFQRERRRTPEEKNHTPMSEARQASFMNRLLRRQKRRSLTLS